jgi:hypothetical protein
MWNGDGDGGDATVLHEDDSQGSKNFSSGEDL